MAGIERPHGASRCGGEGSRRVGRKAESLDRTRYQAFQADADTADAERSVIYQIFDDIVPSLR